MRFTAKDYENAVKAAASAWENAEKAKDRCYQVSGEALILAEQRATKAIVDAEKASEYTQYVYQNQIVIINQPAEEVG